ncbi:MAG: YicC family protein [Candidatus Latescibacteria bacterium]|nr:YicC family protein [Candidatus Latescibacterota bacterium]
MVRSMTGFGRCTTSDPQLETVVEIHSVNNRFLDVVVRGGREVMQLEPRIRDVVRRQLERGRITVTVGMEGAGEGEPVVDIERAEEYLKILNTLRERLDLPGEPDLAMLAGFRDVISANATEEAGEEIWGNVKPALEEALNALVVMREREGTALSEDLEQRFEAVEESLGGIEKLAPGRSAEYAERLKSRVEEILTDTALDENRLYSEIALFADRVDISEECTRLRSHLNQARHIMAGPDPAGRQLNFLLQEMHREVNTIGSKANDQDIGYLVVATKEELEKIREQVQNIE